MPNISNRARIDQMFQVTTPVLDDFISATIGAENREMGANWVELIRAKDGNPSGRDYDPFDPQIQFRMLSEGITHAVKPGWRPFRDAIGRQGETYAQELRQTRNDWAHNKPFTDDDAYRALDTGERLMALINAPEAAAEVRKLRVSLRRMTADRDDKKVLKASVGNPSAQGLRPWREVLPPHHDVATGNFHASEFAADLYKVATSQSGDVEYSDPGEFFRRTYLTEGLKDLIERAVKRLNNDPNASPVINLQTNFGGGKTHSMLSLWHLAAGLPLDSFPQETQELLQANGYVPRRVNRVAIVGNHISPAGATKPDGTRINTLWGELAWQLGGPEAFQLVARADADRTPPGQALHTLLARYAPAVILIDEWVAYARSLVGRDDLAGGSFDDQFTFAQALTEAAKGTPGALLAISIPASDVGKYGDEAAGNAEEVGGANGLEALKRLQNVVRRVADQWRPASSTEAYHIVKQRLFTQPTPESLAEINATAHAFLEMYRASPSEFPSEVRDNDYVRRIRETYPLHPELFDTLYEEWSSLERFQRTRGVLRLMATVIHALWTGDDQAPMILPGSIPLSASSVNSELTQYLADSWKAIIDADVDGPSSEPVRIDTDNPQFGARALTKRLARTVFFGAAPTIAPGATTKGIVTQRVMLGTAMPGDVVGNFHAALNRLQDRATYFYSGNGKYWYDIQANITRTARDQADSLHIEDVWADITRRLAAQASRRGDFAALHTCPDTSSDIPDLDTARLVVLHPRFAHAKGKDTSEAMDFAHQATASRGTANRTHRNTLVYLAPDAKQLDSLEAAIRDYLGWSFVLDSGAELDLTENQRTQARTRKAQADQTATTRLVQAYIWALVPTQPNPQLPFTVDERRIDTQGEWLAERVAKRLGNDGNLSTRQAANTIRLAIQNVPQIWQAGHVTLGTLWSLYSDYCYMPRLRDRTVLEHGVTDMPLHWQLEGFALATRYNDDTQRYEGLWTPEHVDQQPPATIDSMLLVRADVAAVQMDQDARTRDPEPTTGDGTGDSTGSETGGTGGVAVTPPPPLTPDPAKAIKTRFYGQRSLNPDRLAMDFKQISDEILAHLRANPSTRISVHLEVEATEPTGFTEAQIRTVSENAATLKFDQHGFEES